MRNIIEVQLKARRADVTEYKAEMLVLGAFSDEKRLDKLGRTIDSKLNGAIKRVIRLGDFKATPGTNAVVYGNERIGAKRVMLVGLGEKKKATADTARKAAANAAKKAVEMKVQKLGLAVHAAFGNRFQPAILARAMAEGTYFGSYRYDEFVSGAKDARLAKLAVAIADTTGKDAGALRKGVAVGKAIGGSQSYGRTIANRPGNVINPPSLAREARKMARGYKSLQCTIFNEKQLIAKGMGGILAVGSGSASESRFIALHHKPTKIVKGTPTVRGPVSTRCR